MLSFDHQKRKNYEINLSFLKKDYYRATLYKHASVPNYVVAALC
jgi:hypothetical protein